jgi:hypothetical protein
MAMLFTEQGNIDEVLFFPMTRPVLSPVNAAIYGLGRTEAAARLPAAATLSLEDFETLLADAAIQPLRGRIAIYPHLVIWPESSDHGRRRMSGYAELEGFAATGRWQVPVHSVTTLDPIDREREAKALLDIIQRRLTQVIQAHFDDCEVYVHDVAVEGEAG